MNRAEMKRTPLQEKVDFVRELAKQALQISNNDWYICKILTKLAHANESYVKKYGAKKLTTEDLLMQQLLRDHGINPHTAYSWFLLLRCPEDIRLQLDSGMISQRQAITQSANKKVMPNKRSEMELLTEIRTIMAAI
jgi:hypothetical protein